MKKISLIIIFFLSVTHVYPVSKSGKHEWGISAINIGNAFKGTVSIEQISKDANILSINRFYRIGGENIPSTPTECKVTYTADSLFVLFRCTENNMSFPAIGHENWFSLLGSPVEQDASFPDKVDLFLLPSMNETSYYQFSVTINGRQFGSKFNAPQELQDADGTVPRRKHERVADFNSKTVRSENEWAVLISIPWSTIGGKPHDYFGLTPIRTRWRNSEVSSPVALDFSDRPAATDLFIETHLGGRPKIHVFSNALCRLPSGTLRWQRPATVVYPNEKTKNEIWKMQSSNQPTTNKNLADRLTLLQQWVCLMELEGFNFGSTRGSLPEEDMYVSKARIEINNRLLKNDISAACRLADEYLAKIDNVSRKWFADSSPGNIQLQAWTPVTELLSVESRKDRTLLTCKAGTHTVNLYLSRPETGGIRLYSDTEGFFKPERMSSLHMIDDSKARVYSYADHTQRIIVNKKPFSIYFADSAGTSKLQITGIAFRFDPDGKISAVDVKTGIENNEVIFGFGEKFDTFNQNGNVLTLWGMDDWLGLTTGLQNQSYKPIPIYHSSKGYMVFINSSYRLRADIGRSEPGRIRLNQHGNIFDYYLWICEPEQALQSYTSLTGKPVLPPKWAFEPWMGRTGRGWRATALSPVDEKKRVIRRFEELDIPHSAIYAEGVGAEMPDLHTFCAPRNIKVLSWFYSAVNERTQRKLMPEADDRSLPFLWVDNPDKLASRDISYIDFTHPNAKELSRRWWKLRLDLGIAGSMVDFGDRVPEDVTFYNGKKGAEMHNFYAYDYHRTYAEVFSERRGNDFILFGRSAAPGTQKWIAQFPGDLRGNYRGLEGGINGMLNLCSGGFSVWGSDLGGFRAWPEPNVYIRWTQFSCFSPLMRTHGRVPGEPWEYGDVAISNYKHYAWVRENLLDYIYHSAVESNKSGIPMVRSMPVAFPGQSVLAKVDDQYMFGQDLLVCPVITDDNRRDIVFPPGKWTSLWDGNTISETVHVQTEVPIETIPVYMREGAVIPVDLNSNLRFGESMTNDRVKTLILTLPGEKTDFTYNQDSRVVIKHKEKTYDITLENVLDVIYLIVYELSITGVKVDSTVIPQLTGDKLETLPPGWFPDPEMKRTVIRLPRGLSKKVELVMNSGL